MSSAVGMAMDLIDPLGWDAALERLLTLNGRQVAVMFGAIDQRAGPLPVAAFEGRLQAGQDLPDTLVAQHPATAGCWPGPRGPGQDTIMFILFEQLSTGERRRQGMFLLPRAYFVAASWKHECLTIHLGGSFLTIAPRGAE